MDSSLKKSLVEEEISPIHKVEHTEAGQGPAKSRNMSENKDFASRYEMCMVCPANNGEFTEKCKGYVNILLKNGLELFAYHGHDMNHIILLIRAPIEKLRNYADDIDFKLLLDKDVLQKTLKAGNKEREIAPIEIPHNPEIAPFEPTEYIYGKYSRRMPDELYFKEEGQLTPFSDTVRVKLTSLLVEANPPDGGQNLKIRRYLYRLKTLLGYFALHDPDKKLALSESWLGGKWVRPWNQPFDQIKDYFGEKICLYFVFLGHYTAWLSAPAVIGLVLQIVVFAMDDFSAPFLPFYSYFIALWAIFMLEYWKRKESLVSLRWGTIGFEESENDRPDYKGDSIISFVNGAPMRYFSSGKQSLYVAQSFIAIFLLICVVIGMVTSIYIIRFSLQPSIGANAQTLASILNAIQIQIANAVYSFLAVALTDRENHRTETLYEDSLIGKIFLFQFVNSYASFFYLAFLADLFGDCPSTAAGGCMKPLAINLGIIFGSRLLSGNIVEILIPYLSYRYKLARITKSLSGNLNVLTRPEVEFLMDPYDVQSSSIAEYAELAIQFGYSSLFVAALPMASACSLISNVVENTGDAWKLMNLYQRPVPKAAQDIGVWQSIFLIISVASVITNASLTVFTMTVLDKFSDFTRFWIYIAFQWSCFVFQAFLMEAIPDVPESVEIQCARTEFIVSKVIDQVADDAEECPKTEVSSINIAQHPAKGVGRNVLSAF